jgi:hypothetical protein
VNRYDRPLPYSCMGFSRPRRLRARMSIVARPPDEPGAAAVKSIFIEPPGLAAQVDVRETAWLGGRIRLGSGDIILNYLRNHGVPRTCPPNHALVAGQMPSSQFHRNDFRPEWLTLLHQTSSSPGRYTPPDLHGSALFPSDYSL